MYEQITKRILQIINLNNKEVQHFTSKLQVKHLDKKHLIVQEGSICKLPSL